MQGLEFSGFRRTQPQPALKVSPNKVKLIDFDTVEEWLGPQRQLRDAVVEDLDALITNLVFPRRRGLEQPCMQSLKPTDSSTPRLPRDLEELNRPQVQARAGH